MKRLLASLMACIGLISCGTVADEDSAFGQAFATLSGNEEFHPRFLNLLALEAPAIQVGFIERESNGTLLLERQSGAHQFWIGPDGAQIILEDGILNGTRGLGEGLLASELSQTLARVRGLQPGPTERFHTYLDGTDRAVTRTYNCMLSLAGANAVALRGQVVMAELIREDCNSLDEQFTNIYWVTLDERKIVQSRQWAGPFVGNISTRIIPQ